MSRLIWAWRVWYNTDVFRRETAKAADCLGTRHSSGTDRERQATQEGRHPFPPSDVAIQFACCKAVGLGNLRNFRERYYAGKVHMHFLSLYSRKALSGPPKEYGRGFLFRLACRAVVRHGTRTCPILRLCTKTGADIALSWQRTTKN